MDQDVLYTTDQKKSTSLEPARKQIDDLAWLLDNCFGIPGTRWRFGIDSLLGLIPGAGDVTSAVFGLVLLFRALQFRLPKIVIVRMISNHLLDFTLGSIPVIGDVFDFFYKSNLRNRELFHEYATEPAKKTTSHWLFVFALVLGLAAVVVFIILAGGYLLYSLLRLPGNS